MVEVYFHLFHGYYTSILCRGDNQEKQENKEPKEITKAGRKPNLVLACIPRASTP
jgi:hypothetical protein